MQQGFQPMTSWLNLTLNTDPKLAKLVTDRVIDSKYGTGLNSRLKSYP